MLEIASLTILHLGSGRYPILGPAGVRIITLDADPRLKPDVVSTLGDDDLPFDDDSINAAVANHVLEHIGRTGETTGWFRFWEELYRVLKPGGTLKFESPLYSSVWAWADPSHVRALSPQSFGFLQQANYRVRPSAISPYRIQCDFEPAGPYEMVRDTQLQGWQTERASHFRGLLRAIKPLRPWWEDA